MSFCLNIDKDSRDDDLNDCNYFEDYVKQIITRHTGDNTKKKELIGQKGFEEVYKREEHKDNDVLLPDVKISVTGYGYGGDVENDFSNTETLQPISSFSELTQTIQHNNYNEKDKHRNSKMLPSKKAPSVTCLVKAKKKEELERNETLELHDIHKPPPHELQELNKPQLHELHIPQQHEVAVHKPQDQSDGDKIADKPYYKFANNIQQALSTLNNQMSSTLRDSIVNIDEISTKVRQCLTEMDKHTKIYYSQFRAQSTPNLMPLPELAVAMAQPLDKMPDNTEEVQPPPKANDFEPCITQSENQIRIVADKVEMPKQQVPQSDDGSTEAFQKAHEDFTKGVKELQNCMKRVCKDMGKAKVAKRKSPHNHQVPLQTSTCKSRTNIDAVNIMRERKERKDQRLKVLMEKCRRNHRERCATRAVAMSLPSPSVSPQTIVQQPSKTLDLTRMVKSVDVNITKGKPIHDIHEKLKAQLDATDSLREFQLQMRRKPKTLLKISAEELYVPSRNINKITKRPPPEPVSPKPVNIKNKKKVAGKSSKPPKQKQKSANLTPPPSRLDKRSVPIEKKYENSLWFPSLLPGGEKKKNEAVTNKCNCSMVVHNEKPVVCNEKHINTNDNDQPSSNKYLSAHSRFRMQLMRNNGKFLNCFDILDELTNKDVEPLKAEYPRKDLIMPDPSKHVENSYLYKLVYDQKLDNHMTELLGGANVPSITCTTPDCNKCKKRFKSKTPEKSKSSEKPKITRYQNDRRIKSEKSVPSKSGKKQDKKTTNLTGSHAIEKLKPYLKDPQLRYPTTITIMPVRVIYNNFNLDPKMQPKELPPTVAASSKVPPITIATKSPPSKGRAAPGQTNLLCANTSLRRTDPCGDFNPKKADLLTSGRAKKMTAAERKALNKSDGQLLLKDIELNQTDMSQQKKISVLKPVVIKQPRSTVQAKRKMPTKVFSKSANDSRRMLYDIQTLAHKNKNLLQANIQKVIEIIESKIVDILSDPKKHSADAFLAVETEIKEVLDMMRTMDSTLEKPTPKRAKEVSKAKSIKPKLGGGKSDLLLAKLRAIADAEQTSLSETNATMRSLTTPTLTPPSSPPLGVRTNKVTVNPVENKTSDMNTISQSTLVHEEDSGLSSNEEKCVVTNACSPQTFGKAACKQANDAINQEENAMKGLVPYYEPEPEPNKNLAIVKSDMFLTPFMQAIKQIRKNETAQKEVQEVKPSYHHIIQFLDTLTNISENITDTSVTVYYSYVVNVSYVVQHAVVYYEVKQYYRITNREKLPQKIVDNKFEIISGSYATNLKSLLSKEKLMARDLTGRFNYSDLLTFDGTQKIRNISCYTVLTMFTKKPVTITSQEKKQRKKACNKHYPPKSKCLPANPILRKRTENYVLNIAYACIFTLIYIAFAVNMPGI